MGATTAMPLLSVPSVPTSASQPSSNGIGGSSAQAAGSSTEETVISSSASTDTAGSTVFLSCADDDVADDDSDFVDPPVSTTVVAAASGRSESSAVATTSPNIRHGRQGTISSACFNIWSTMVGGGSLSLPLAFGKTGNAFLAPVLLIVVAAITEFCFRVLLDAARTISALEQNNSNANASTRSNRTATEEDDVDATGATQQGQSSNRSPAPRQSHRHLPAEPERDDDRQALPGMHSLERISAAAFGSTAYIVSTLLVYFMCFFGIVGYCVLLRDMLEPVTKLWWPLWPSSLDASAENHTMSLGDNLSMWTVVMVVTPLCTLQTLTSLQHVGAASMFAVVLLGLCIVYRSVQCTVGVIPHHHPVDPSGQGADSHWTDGFRFFPESWHDVLDVIPLFISCYVCHYNIPVVYNDLQNPSPARVRWWLKSTVWGSTAFYMTMGLAGSVYATACSDSLHGNILLDFPMHDPLVLMGRLCLAVTISLAFPVLTLPARDILLRTVGTNASNQTSATDSDNAREEGAANSLTEPLLSGVNDDHVEATRLPPQGNDSTRATGVPRTDEEQGDSTRLNVPNAASTTLPQRPHSVWMRLLASIAVLWTGTALASCVSSIDIVWDLLGSSLSILLSYLIPCGSFWVLVRQKNNLSTETSRWRDGWAVAACWVLIAIFIPLMFVSTANAIHNTFTQK